VDNVPDIEFSEVTWGKWHVEAALVYLTDAYIKDVNGNVFPYGVKDDSIGYYAGIIWNKIGIKGLTVDERIALAENYFSGTRDFSGNTYYEDENFAVSQFYLPDEVVKATGIRLVDITVDVFDTVDATQYPLALPESYTNLEGTGNLVTLINGYSTPITSEDVITDAGNEGNTDGFDLDAIRVYKIPPYFDDDTATGYGDRIRKRGKWFMYNIYPEKEGDNCYDIQAGNPKNELNIIGEYCIEENGDNTYIATYDIDDTIIIGEWIYEIKVVDEHLAISDKMNFKAIPGRDDNADFGVPFNNDNGKFYIFAHFAVEYN
jgi:hypothetical protein